MATKPLPDRALLRQLIDYDPAVGTLTWRHRHRSLFKNDAAWRRWNTRYAGKVAGCPDTYGRIVVGIGRTTLYFAHRLVWLIVHGEPVPEIIDHKDMDRSNNRIDNLRAASASQNLANSRRSPRNTSGHKGVYQHRHGGFVAQVQFKKQHFYLGYFPTATEADAARRAWAGRIHGEFARHD